VKLADPLPITAKPSPKVAPAVNSFTARIWGWQAGQRCRDGAEMALRLGCRGAAAFPLPSQLGGQGVRVGPGRRNTNSNGVVTAGLVSGAGGLGPSRWARLRSRIVALGPGPEGIEP
jgi:hypothetical protein